MMIWTMVTDFGDSAAMVPAAVAIALWLGFGQAWRRLLVWVVAFGVAAMLVTLSKIAFIGWGIGVEALNFTGFSGHSMLATAVLSVSAYLASEQAPRAGRWLAVAAGLAGGVMIGFSRLALAVHSVSEVVAGLALGALVVVAFVVGSRGSFAPAIRPLLGFGAVVVLLGAIHGEEAPSQGLITQIALQLSGRTMPFARPIRLEAASEGPAVARVQ